MIAAIQKLTLRRDLLVMMVWRDLRVKYKQSLMGALWAVLTPALIVAAGVLVRYGMAVLSGKPLTLDDVALVSAKSVPWAFFVSAVKFATNSLISNANLITKIGLPREIFPLASVLSQCIDLIVASVVLSVVLAVAGTGASLYLLWVPVLLLILFALALACGLITSAASLFFRDVKYLIDVALTFGIFFTPVFYEAATFKQFERVLLLNPVAPIMEGIGEVVAHQAAPALGWIGYSAGFAAILLVLAYAFFNRLQPYFAEAV